MSETWNYCLIDSPDALRRARELAPGAVLATDNPMLAEMAANHAETDDLDRYLSSADADAVTLLSLQLVEAIDECLNRDDIADRYGLVRNHLRLAGGTSRMVGGLLYRTAALMAGLSKRMPAAILICAMDADPPAGIAPIVPERFLSPWPRLARLGFFGKTPVRVETVDTELPVNINDTASRSQFRRFAPVPTKALIYLTLQRLGLLRSRQKRIILASDNELIRETLPWLSAAGIEIIGTNVTEVGKKIAPRPADPSMPVDANLKALLEPVIMAHLGTAPWFKNAGIGALAHLIIWHIDGALQRLAQRLPAMRKEVRRLAEMTAAPRFMLVNGLFGGDGAQLYGLCREAGIRVLDFEHGVTTGLSAHSQAKIRFSEATACDEMFVCSETAAAGFAAASRQPPAIHNVGLSEQTRVMVRPRLQRFLARQALSLKGDHPAVMHVSTTPFMTNQRSGPYLYTESAVFDQNRVLIDTVYNRLAGWQVLFKDYPTQRFPYEPAIDGYTRPASHIQFLATEDLRYVRAAADVIVTGVPTSTLGWCIGVDVPLIWMDSPFTPLLEPGLEDAFRDSFLFIDQRDPAWPEQLRGLLGQGRAAIEAEWQRKRKVREETLRRHIIGPQESPGRQAAKIILSNFAGDPRLSCQVQETV